MPSINVTEAEKTKWESCKAKGNHPAIVCKRQPNQTSSKKQKHAADDISRYSIPKCKKIIVYWAKGPIKPKPKNKRQWLEALGK
jgi:hypothetical protein